jgi:polysaccharide biosynthesis protein PslH
LAEQRSRTAAIVRSGTRTPRILYLSRYWPDQPSSAGEVRALHVGRALQQFGRVEVVVIDGDGQTEEWAKREERESDVAYRLRVQPRPNGSLIQKVNWALNPRVKSPHGIAVDQQSLERVLDTARQFDLIWFSELRTANMFPCWAWPRSVVDVNDVPSMFERSVLRTERAPGQRLSTLLRLWSWKRRDALLGERFTVVAVCSENDKQYLQALGVNRPIHVVPNGFERPAVAPIRRLAKPPRIGFIGVLDYGPNLAGIEWFARHCWPRIKMDVPDARLRLVGRFSDGPLKPVGVDIEALGWMADPTEEIATWSAMIVPVHVGAGTRGKIAHAFSQRCPVVSTSLGAYGYGARDGHEMFLADSAESFAEACVRTIRQPVAAAAMAERAWQQFLDKWTWDAIGPHVSAAADECLRAR